MRRLTRSRSEQKIAGVCGGLAEFFDVDVVLIRTAFVVFSIVPGAIVGGLIAYAAAWLIMPEGTDLAPSPRIRRLTLSATDRQIAGVCGGIAEYFAIDATVVRLLWVMISIFAFALVGGVLAYLVAWLIMPRPSTAVLSPAAPSPA